MPRGPAKFKQYEIERAVRGVIAGGADVYRTEIRADGCIVIVSKPDASLPPADALLEEFKIARARRNARSA